MRETRSSSRAKAADGARQLPEGALSSHAPRNTTKHQTATPPGPPFRDLTVYLNLPPPAKPAVGSVRVLPSGCGAPRGTSFPCTGFAWTGGAGPAPNEATFNAVPSGPVPVAAPGAPPVVVRVARVGLLNGGALLPADAGAAVVKATATLVALPASTSLAPMRIPLGDLTAFWTPGSPAPPNEAGVFRLAQLPPAKTFEIEGVKYSFELKGLRLAPQDKMAGTVPWPARIASTPGQPAPPSGMGPSLSVYQPKGEVASVVDLVGSIVKV